VHRVGVGAVVMAGWDLGLDYGHAGAARMLQTFGLAFLFIPINVAAFAYVPKEKSNMGTGIINLARNMGASVGIATVTTMLERRAQFHQSRLMSTSTISARVSQHAERDAGEVDRGGLDGGARQRASTRNDLRHDPAAGAMLAFIDNFKMLGVVFFAVIPILVLMRKPKAPAGSVPVH